MDIDEILINIRPGETRIALLGQARLCELEIVRDTDQSLVGNVYLGRVEKVPRGLAAAFVDIGLGRSGFLALAEARAADLRSRPESNGAKTRDRVSDYLNEGDAVLVQVLRDPSDDKGAKLTTRITLSGRYLVYVPGLAEIKISRRIEDDDTGARLAAFIRGEAQESEGFILRTAAAAANDEDLSGEIGGLRAAWTAIGKNRNTSKPPVCLHKNLDPLLRILRNCGGRRIKLVTIDDMKVFAKIREYCQQSLPEMTAALERHDGADGLFEAAGVEEQIERALSPIVALPSGGSIIIEETAALTAIDVNTGRASGRGGHEETALATNLEAAAEAARQIRLRNLAGALIIDFVPMRYRGNGAAVLTELRRAVASDPCIPHVIGFTKLGLIEMTRRKQRRSLNKVLMNSCRACAGTGAVKSPVTVAIEALRRVRREAAAKPATAWSLTAAPEVIKALGGPAMAALAETEACLGRPLRLTSDGALPGEEFGIAPVDMEGNGEDG